MIGRRLAAALGRRTAVVVLLLLYAVPALFILLAAFKRSNDIVNHPSNLLFTPTLAGFRAVLNHQLLTAMFNSLKIAGAATAITIVCAVPFAYSLARLHGRWTGIVVGVLIALQMMPTAVSVIPIYRVLALLHLLGSISGVALALAATNLPFAVLLLRPFFRSVPLEVVEAAEVDGGSEWRIFLSIAIPLARNGISLVAVLLFIGAWGEFLYSISFLNDPGRFPLSVLIVEQQGYYGTQWNNLMALAVVGALPALIVFVFVARRLASGLTLGYGK